MGYERFVHIPYGAFYATKTKDWFTIMKKIQVLSHEQKIEKLVKSYVWQISKNGFGNIYGKMFTPSKAKRFAESRCKFVPEYIREQVTAAVSDRVYDISREV